MAYSRYFGMRSFENVIRDGRFRVPRTGEPFKIGAPVKLNDAAPGAAGYGELEAAGAAEVPGPNCGLVVFEHIQNKSDALTTVYDSPYDQVPLGQYAQMMHGPGTKVWFRNVDDKTMYDGRTQSGGGLLADSVDPAALTPGTGLAPDGDGGFAVVGEGETAWLIVEQSNPSTGRVEARLTF